MAKRCISILLSNQFFKGCFCAAFEFTVLSFAILTTKKAPCGAGVNLNTDVTLQVPANRERTRRESVSTASAASAGHAQHVQQNAPLPQAMRAAASSTDEKAASSHAASIFSIQPFNSHLILRAPRRRGRGLRICGLNPAPAATGTSGTSKSQAAASPRKNSCLPWLRR